MIKTIDKIIKQNYEDNELIKHCCKCNKIFDRHYKKSLFNLKKLDKKFKKYIFNNYEVTSSYCDDCLIKYLNSRE